LYGVTSTTFHRNFLKPGTREHYFKLGKNLIEACCLGIGVTLEKSEFLADKYLWREGASQKAQRRVLSCNLMKLLLKIKDINLKNIK
jgi:hypothetical protein